MRTSEFIVTAAPNTVRCKDSIYLHCAEVSVDRATEFVARTLGFLKRARALVLGALAQKRGDKIMSLALAVLLFLSASAHSEHSKRIAINNWVIIYGEMKNCPEFPGIIAAHRARGQGLSVLGLPQIEVLGKSPEEVRITIGEALRRSEDEQPPKSLRVELLNSEQDYLALRDQVAHSFRFLASDRCRTPKPQPPDPEWRNIGLVSITSSAPIAAARRPIEHFKLPDGD